MVSTSPVGNTSKSLDVFGDFDPVSEFIEREREVMANIDEMLDPGMTSASMSQDVFSLNGTADMLDTSLNISEPLAQLEIEQSPSAKPRESDEFSLLFVRDSNNGEKLSNESSSPTSASSSSSSSQVSEHQDNPDPEDDVREELVEKVDFVALRNIEIEKSLAIKDEEEAKQKAELAAQGKRELDEFYANYHKKLDEIKKTNREIEQQWIKERDDVVPGKEWEKVANMCDFRTSHNSARDTSRMRSILIKQRSKAVKTNADSSS
ncbi:uncharacterized protein LOC141852961 [Brevipalpus obovatus]|uniref:uncharacterized protein LOC141852961 n=1 Tax=Brevipalpus obovatus TaxID=246614 RepID=UPI003D9E1C60